MSIVTIKSYRPQVEARIMSNLEKGLSKAGMIVVKQAKKNVIHPLPSGKMHDYKDTNRLSASVGSATDGVFRMEKSAKEMSVLVGTKVDYGLYLEFGTSRMPPYPWLFPAVESTRSETANAIKTGGGMMLGSEVAGGVWEG